MGFPDKKADELLVACGRKCAICGKLHGVSLHHIKPRENGGTDVIDNAIPLCPNCHDEVHGTGASGRVVRKYTEGELKLHRQRLKDWVAAGMTSGNGHKYQFPIWHILQHQNPCFTGRDELLSRLHANLASGGPTALTQTQAVHGLGGVGKTQIAVEYCYRHKADFDVVWWVKAAEPVSLAADYAGLATELDLPEKDAVEQPETVKAVRRWLEKNAKWLLVFDNADNPAELDDYLPRGGDGRVIVTSRNPNWSDVAALLPVELMERAESVEFILKRTGLADKDAANLEHRLSRGTHKRQHAEHSEPVEERSMRSGLTAPFDTAQDAGSVPQTVLLAANELAEALGDLPLALAQASAYIAETGRSISHYLELFRSRQQEMLAKGHAQGYDATVATTWEISFQRVEKESPAAADLLNLCAFLAPDDIPLDMINGGAEFLPPSLADAVKDDLKLNEALSWLRRYSLAQIDDASISVHRLVQVAAQARLAKQDAAKWIEAAVRVVSKALPEQPDDVRTWPVCSRLLPHALATAQHAESASVAPNAAGRVINQAGLYLLGRADFPAAKEALERALKKAQATFGPHDPRVATTLNNLGSVLKALGDLDGARKCFERALNIAEDAFGPEHPNVASIVNNVGSLLKALGDLDRARKCFERALKIDEAAFGPEHPEVATDVNNLGSVLQDLGDMDGARKCFERALKIDETAFGLEHPNVARVVNNLGSVLHDLGDLDGARKCYERALAICRRFLGDDHPSTITVRENLESLNAESSSA